MSLRELCKSALACFSLSVHNAIRINWSQNRPTGGQDYGLDMYLQTENKQTGKAVIIHSWRKANQIRDWFVRRFELDPNDQLKIPITRDDLDALTSDIEQVLTSHALALELLPTASGFFFGSTDYDGYYFEVLRDTRHFLQKEFTYNSDSENLYYTEWW